MVNLRSYISSILKIQGTDQFDYVKYIKSMKKMGHGLMSVCQYMNISKELAEAVPCNLLVFGLGQDSYLWDGINENGRTIFLEDDDEWIGQVNNGALNVYKVEYSTRVEDYQEIGFDETRLTLDLPEEVIETEWDFVIVDGPLGHQPPRPYRGPGRMSSIFIAYKLLRRGGVAIVDDMGRPIEREFAYHFFGEKQLKTLIENKVGVFKKNE